MKSIYNILVFVMIILVAWISYLWYQTFDFNSYNFGFTIPNNRYNLTAITNTNDSIQKQIDNIRTSSKVATFELAKIIDSSSSNTNRYDKVNKIYDVYGYYSKANKTALNIKDFYINNSDFGINWDVIDLKYIYNSGFILQKIKDTWIFEEVSAPRSNKQNNDNMYNFEIRWIIKS